MTTAPYDLASVAVPDDTLALSVVEPALEQPGPRPWTVGKLPSLPPCQPTSVHARRPLPRSASDASTRAEEPCHPRPVPSTERHRRSRRARKIFSPQPRPPGTTAPCCFGRHQAKPARHRCHPDTRRQLPHCEDHCGHGSRSVTTCRDHAHAHTGHPRAPPLRPIKGTLDLASELTPLH
jgi:hypothetical protein